MAVGGALYSFGVERMESMRGPNRAQVIESKSGKVSNSSLGLSFLLFYSFSKHLLSMTL